jgi:hypothetical protein
MPRRAGQLPTTNRTTSGDDVDTAAVTAARRSVPSASDLTSTPISAACHACHANPLAAAHMELMGGVLESFPTNSASRLHPAPRASRRVASLRRIP